MAMCAHERFHASNDRLHPAPRLHITGKSEGRRAATEAPLEAWGLRPSQAEPEERLSLLGAQVRPLPSYTRQGTRRLELVGRSMRAEHRQSPVLRVECRHLL